VRITVDDGVALEVVEQGTGPLLVLVHGFGGAKEDFADHLDVLARTHRVVTFDHRGHGESDKPDRAADYSIDRLAADTLAVADALGAGTFRLLGHSLGGMVARRVVLAAPERIEALVLMDTSPGPIPGMDGELMEAAAQLALDAGMDVLKQVMDDASPLGTPAYERLLADRPGYREFQDRKWESLAAMMWATLVREIRDQPDQLADLGAIVAPTLVIVGALDAPFLGPSDAMAATIPGAQLAVVPDAGHSPQFENPDVWLAALEGFLASVGAGAPPSPVA
jgi:pimeloyl-ACP methyl ester carboxylesterase